MIEAEVINPPSSTSEFALAVVAKEDGKPRECVYFRPLNRRMKADGWPLPNIVKLIESALK